MSIFCKHKWKVVSTSYAPPIKEFYPSVLLNWREEKILHGVTTLIWNCEKCQKIREKEMLGQLLSDNQEKKV